MARTFQEHVNIMTDKLKSASPKRKSEITKEDIYHDAAIEYARERIDESFNNGYTLGKKQGIKEAIVRITEIL
jgi:hypothetical protein